MPSDTNPYGGVFGGWLMGQMGLACGSFASRRTRGKAILVGADAIKFPGAMAVGDELSVFVDLLKQGRTSLRLKAEAVGRQRDSETQTVVAEGEFTFVALDEAGKPRVISTVADPSPQPSPSRGEGSQVGAVNPSPREGEGGARRVSAGRVRA